MIHNEADGIAASAAAETVVHAFRFADGKAGRLFLMEWAAGRPVLSTFFQVGQVAANHADDVLVGAVNGMLRD